MPQIEMSEHGDWHWYRIKAELEAKGLTLTRLSQQHGRSPGYAAKVKNCPIPRAQAIIANALGRSPQEIWPSRYTPEGRPVSRVRWIAAHKRRHAPHGLGGSPA